MENSFETYMNFYEDVIIALAYSCIDRLISFAIISIQLLISKISSVTFILNA